MGAHAKPPKPRGAGKWSARARIKRMSGKWSGEIVLHRTDPRELEDATLVSKHGMYVGKIPKPGTRSIIHTHDYWRKGKAFIWPSGPDIKNLLNDARRSIRNWHIAEQDKNGNVKGYLSFHAPPRFAKAINKDTRMVQVSSQLSQLMPHSMVRPKSVEAYKQLHIDTVQILKEMGLRMHVTPMPGYRFNGHAFVKKPVRKKK